MEDNHTADDHIRKLNHDCALAEELAEKDDYYDWTITYAFYFAIHCIEAYAHQHGQEAELKQRGLDENEESLHRVRERYVRKHLRGHYGAYEALYKKSRKSRYDPTYFEKISKVVDYHKRLLESAQKMKTILQ